MIGPADSHISLQTLYKLGSMLFLNLNLKLSDSNLCRNTREKMVKKKPSKDSYVFSTRLDYEQYHMLKTIAAIESSCLQENVSVQDLIRQAIKFVYEDNERLRECFRRIRSMNIKRLDSKFKL